MALILVIEDEVVLARAMSDALSAVGHSVHVVHAGEKAVSVCRDLLPELVLLDIRLGAVNGIDVLRSIKAEWPETEVIMLTAYGSVEVAVQAMKLGATEFLTKPVDLDVLAAAVDKVCAASRARRRLGQFEAAQQARLEQAELLGECPAIREIRSVVSRLAERSATAESPPPCILLTGETGTGKDLLAAVLHARLPQQHGPFVTVNCAAVPGELFESELFGHKRGAFTGATGDKSGLFETADGGTLMLDEIGEMPLTLQPKLLRAIETQTVRRIGETRDRPVRLCVIAATNRDLARAVADRRFRQDLYYRLNVVRIELPPIRDRGEDLIVLANHCCTRLAARYALPGLSLSPEALDAIRRYPWPGNVRELQNAIERAALIGNGRQIRPEDLGLPAAATATTGVTNRAAAMVAALAAGEAISMDELEKAVTQQALERTGGNVSAAARLLSIGREAMRYRMTKYGMGGSSADEAPLSDGA